MGTLYKNHYFYLHNHWCRRRNSLRNRNWTHENFFPVCFSFRKYFHRKNWLRILFWSKKNNSRRCLWINCSLDSCLYATLSRWLVKTKNSSLPTTKCHDARTSFLLQKPWYHLGSMREIALQFPASLLPAITGLPVGFYSRKAISFQYSGMIISLTVSWVEYTTLFLCFNSCLKY